MNITLEESGKLTAVVHINLKEEDYSGKVNEQLKEYRKKAQMPGFRPGMVPMGMVKKMYGKAVMADEVNKAVSEALNEYLYNEKINVLGNPLPNEEKSTIIDFDQQNEFDFYFDIAIAPEVENPVDDKLKATYYKIKVTEEEIDRAVQDMQKRLGKHEHPETAEETDSLEGTLRQLDDDKNVLAEGYTTEGSLALPDVKLKTVVKEFTGKSKGDKVVFNPKRALKDEALEEALLNLENGDEKLGSDYEFEIKDIVRTEEAEVNEELFNQIYPADELKTEEDFRNRIRQELEGHYQKDADKKFVSDLIDSIIEKANIELPDAFLKRWLVENNQGKATMEQIEGQYDSYAQTFKWQLIEAKLIEAYGDALRVTRDDVRNKLKSYFQLPEGVEPSKEMDGLVDQLLSNEQEYQRHFAELMDERYITFFKEKAGKEEKEVTTDEFVKIISTPKN
ncbi:MAG: trigger factor [Bacteroidales bacterium]|nr:trigger factor [Bacteroidales bacterium]